MIISLKFIEKWGRGHRWGDEITAIHDLNRFLPMPFLTLDIELNAFIFLLIQLFFSTHAVILLFPIQTLFTWFLISRRSLDTFSTSIFVLIRFFSETNVCNLELTFQPSLHQRSKPSASRFPSLPFSSTIIFRQFPVTFPGGGTTYDSNHSAMV
jgi:hypothetical protein